MDGRLLCLALLIVFTNCSLIPLTNSAAAKPVYCDLDKRFPVKVKSVDIDPYPVVSGKLATFKVSATSNKTIPSGNLNIEVYFYGLPVHTENQDLCTKTACPVKQGSFVLTNSQSLPELTTAGEYKLRMKMMNADDMLLTCVYINFKIVHGSLISQI